MRNDFEPSEEIVYSNNFLIRADREDVITYVKIKEIILKRYDDIKNPNRFRQVNKFRIQELAINTIFIIKSEKIEENSNIFELIKVIEIFKSFAAGRLNKYEKL